MVRCPDCGSLDLDWLSSPPDDRSWLECVRGQEWIKETPRLEPSAATATRQLTTSCFIEPSAERSRNLEKTPPPGRQGTTSRSVRRGAIWSSSGLTKQ